MADERTDPLADMFTLFAAPLSGTVRSLEQFRKGVDEFLLGVENFNRTMANLNETTERINSLLADVEEPIRLAVPQVTRTVKAADELMQVVSGPAMAAAPGLTRLVETLNTPAFVQLPNQLGQFSELLGEVSRRLGPLTQIAESAGGLFGGLRVPGARPAPGTGSATNPASPTASTDTGNRPEREDLTIVTRTVGGGPSDPSAAKKPASKKSTAKKKATAKKPPAKKKSTKQSASKKKSPVKKKAAAKKKAAPTRAGSSAEQGPGRY